MDEYIKDLHELCETISEEIGEANKKIKSAGGKLTAGDVDYVDKLTHTLKSIKTTIAMMEADDGEYSSRYSYMGGGMSYARDGRGGNRGGQGGSYEGSYEDGGMSMRGGSYARGRGRNARRDSMGRYSSERGYSRDDGMVEQLRELMEDAPNEQIKREMERLVSKIEQQM